MHLGYVANLGDALAQRGNVSDTVAKLAGDVRIKTVVVHTMLDELLHLFDVFLPGKSFENSIFMISHRVNTNEET